MAKGDVCEVDGCNTTKNVSRSKKYNMALCGKHCAQLDMYGKIFARTVFDKNEIVTSGDITAITLYDGKNIEIGKTVINTRHLDLVINHKWRLSTQGYIMTTVDGKVILLHRLITGAKEGEVVDHINHQTLNNLDENLRVCSRQENGRNSKLNKNNTSGITGVTWHKSAKKWHAQIMVSRKTISLGLFVNINDAIVARKAAEVKYFREYAYDASLYPEVPQKLTEEVI